LEGSFESVCGAWKCRFSSNRKKRFPIIEGVPILKTKQKNLLWEKCVLSRVSFFYSVDNFRQLRPQIVPLFVSLVELALATNAQLRPGGEVLHKQVRQAWNVLCIFSQKQHKAPCHAPNHAYLPPQRSIPVAAMEYSAQ
jgi:hypothetical protein